VSSDLDRPQSRARALPARVQVLLVLILVFAVGAGIWVAKSRTNSDARDPDANGQSKKVTGVFYPTPAQWATLTVEPVQQRVFQSEHVTEGKIAVDEDRSTPIFSPYAGRVIKLFVKPGDTVTVGQALFTVQAADMVQAQNDFISAATALNKARSAQNLAQIIDKRQRLLYEGKAVPLKEVQNARAALDAAENDVRSAEVALEATRNRLRILGKTDQEITDFQEKGTIDPATLITAPIAGTIVQRKVGPANTSAAARPTRSSSSAICRPCGWWPLSARPRRRSCTSASRSISPCWPIRTAPSRPPFPTWLRRSIRPRGGCWCARPSTTTPDCSSRRCSRA
jgi:cobalt-zinc-cadmium efflux system membrane fusion protein